MHKAILVLALLLLPTLAKADIFSDVTDTLKKIPEVKNGAYYSFIDHTFNYSSQIGLIEWKGFSINAGTAGDGDSTDWKAIASASYDFGKLKDFGVNVPIVKYIGFEPYVTIGMGRLNFKEMTDAEMDWGIGVSVLSLKF